MTFTFNGRGPIPGYTPPDGRGALWELTNPEGYEAGDDLAHAVDVAVALKMPLLLTGEPGTGKTQLAFRLAAELTGREPLRFDTKSSTQATDLFYAFDSMRYFAQSQVQALKQKDAPPASGFIRYQGLGAAILRTRPFDEVAHLLPAGHDAWKAARSVVLVDEIDKAPRDFPNDLLNQVENREFAIPELDNAVVRADPDLAPVVVITSNSEKQLPDAFLRRCVYHHIDFAEVRIDDIVARRLGRLPMEKRGYDDAKKFFYTLREPSSGLVKKPSTSELLDWLQALAHRGMDPARPLAAQLDVARPCLGTLAKTEPDIRRAASLLGA